jgi:hypothetical protein
MQNFPNAFHTAAAMAQARQAGLPPAMEAEFARMASKLQTDPELRQQLKESGNFSLKNRRD